jgi:NAD(P)-dependent dehydrogenase (short-subunit alcohol dehydrogenase family)
VGWTASCTRAFLPKPDRRHDGGVFSHRYGEPTGTFLVIQAAAPLMRRPRGAIVNIASGVGLTPTGRAASLCRLKVSYCAG